MLKDFDLGPAGKDANLANLATHDIKRCLAAMPAEVVDVLNWMPGNVCVAGGFIRDVIQREKPKDIDIFVRSKELGKSVAERIAKNRSDLRVDAKETSITLYGLALPVQVILDPLISNNYPIINTFDFTINQAQIYNSEEDGWKSLCAFKFYEHLAAKALIPSSFEQHGGNLVLRMLKFIRRDFHISRQNLADLLNTFYAQVAFEKEVQKLSGEEGSQKAANKLLRTDYTFIQNKRVGMQDANLDELIKVHQPRKYDPNADS